MFGAIAGAVGRVFGTDKAAASLVEGTKSALDKLVYTKEERAEAEAASVTEARTMVIDWMKATSGQNLARRIIALLITSVWLFQYLAMVVMSCIAPWVDKPEKFTETAKIIGGYAEQMNGAMMLILAFYFAAPHMGSIAKGALAKFGKTS